jgi:hypothetical protein
MKIIVRSLVIALAVSGAIATSYAKTSATPVKVSKTSAMPVPACAPGTSTCGMGNW